MCFLTQVHVPPQDQTFHRLRSPPSGIPESRLDTHTHATMRRQGSMQRMGSFMLNKDQSSVPLTKRKMFYIYLVVYGLGAAVAAIIMVLFFKSIAEDAAIYPEADKLVTAAPVDFVVQWNGRACWPADCEPAPTPVPPPT